MTARLCRAPAFLIAWVSSRITRFHVVTLSQASRTAIEVTGDDEVFAAQRLHRAFGRSRKFFIGRFRRMSVKDAQGRRELLDFTSPIGDK